MFVRWNATPAITVKVHVTAAERRPEKVAVIGAGTGWPFRCLWHLARLGYGVTVFEAGSELGGLMRTGIPTYRLPREALDRDIARILELGIETRFNTHIDHERLEQLTHEFDAVLAATGLQRLTSLDLGLDMKRVMQGIEFLDRARNNSVER